MDRERYEKIEYALERIAEKNPLGVDLLYECMGKTMLFVAQGILKDPAAAEDAVQDSFIKIVRHARRYKKGTNGYAWVCRIVRNTALNRFKSEKRRATEDIDEFSHLSDGKDAEEQTTTQLLVKKLMDSLTPPVVKKMIYMKYFLDMTVREIAKEIGKSKSYVSKEILKAEKLMKEMLSK